MAALLALSAALAYGLSDFVGGVVSRRTSPWPVALLSCLGGLVGALALSLAMPGAPTGAHLAWGALSGVGSGAGSAFLYRGFATGRMGVVAPVSGVGAAVLPVAAGVLLGERPSVLVWLGIVIAMPGIWLVAREPGEDLRLGEGLGDGVLAGAGFGLLFVAMGQVPDGAGYWPLTVGQVVSLVIVAATAVLFRARWMPSALSQSWGLVAGLLASAALLAFVLATQAGLLTVAAVLTSLYPAFTVLLAAAVLRERVHAPQGLGLGLCGVAVALVAGG